MLKRLVILTAISLLTTNGFAQQIKTKAGENPRAEFLAAFEKMRTIKKVRITSRGNVNNKLFEETISEYVAPNRYHRLLKKDREGEKIEMESIEIDGQHFEKKGNKWIREPNPIIVIKEEFDLIRSPKFESTKKDILKFKLTDVQFVGQENFNGKAYLIYTFEVVSDWGKNIGKVWISDVRGLPERLEREEFLGRSNKIIGTLLFDYDSEIVIEKPLITR